jgi:hypothetical protein
MFSVNSNIYNKKSKESNLIELLTATGKLKESFYLKTRNVRCLHHGDTAHIDTIFEFLPHRRQHGRIDVLHCYDDPCRARMVLSVGGSLEYLVWNARCTVTTDLLVWYSNTQKDFYSWAAIISLHKLPSPSGRNVNYDKKHLNAKKIFELFLLSVQVS